MFGKGALIFVAGFAIVFSTYRANLNSLIIESYDNFNYHFMKTLVRESCVNAVNYGIQRVWETDIDSDTMTIIQTPCTTFVEISMFGADTLRVKAITRSRVYIDQYFEEHNTTFEILDSVHAFFGFDKWISEYAFFSGHEAGLDWYTGDTAFGPLHVNHILNIKGSPVFYGKVTSKLGIAPPPGSGGNHALFYGGWEIGVDIPFPDDISYLVDIATVSNDGAPVNTLCLYDTEITLKFLSDGNVIRTIGVDPPDTVAITSIAPGAIIYSSADIHVSGVVNGSLALYSGNDIWIDDDIFYDVSPIDDPDSDDLLGIFAERDIILTDNIANSTSVTIHGALFASESFRAENYNTRPIAMLTSVGSVAQAVRGNIAKFSSTNITNGFNKCYHIDSRFAVDAPPHTPTVDEMRLLSWWE